VLHDGVEIFCQKVPADRPVSSSAATPASSEALLAMIEEEIERSRRVKISSAHFAFGTGENSETTGRRLRLTFSKQKGWKMV